MNHKKQADALSAEMVFDVVYNILERQGAVINELPKMRYRDRTYRAKLNGICYEWFLRKIIFTSVELRVFAEPESGGHREKAAEYLDYLRLSSSEIIPLLNTDGCIELTWHPGGSRILHTENTGVCQCFSLQQAEEITAAMTTMIKRCLPVCNAIISGRELPACDDELTAVYRSVFIPAQTALVPIEETDKHGRRILKHVVGRGDRFAVPDGINKIEYNAFEKLDGQLHRVYIPESVKIIPFNTFGSYRNPSDEIFPDKHLILECAADKKPDGFAFKTFSTTSYSDDDIIENVDPPRILKRNKICSWLGGYTVSVTSADNSKYPFADMTSGSFPERFPEVHWGCSRPSWEEPAEIIKSKEDNKYD